MFESGEKIGHGDIGEVGWDFVELAQSLELLPGQAMEIHRDRLRSKQVVLRLIRVLLV